MANDNLNSFSFTKSLKTLSGNNASQGLFTQLNDKLTSFASASKLTNAADIALSSQSNISRKAEHFSSEDQNAVIAARENIAQSSNASSSVLDDIREAEINSLIEEFVMVPSSTATVTSISASEVTVAAKEFKVASISAPVSDAVELTVDASAVPTPPPAPPKGFNILKPGPNFKVIKSAGKTIVVKDTPEGLTSNNDFMKKVAARRAEAEKYSTTSFGNKVEVKPAEVVAVSRALTAMTFDAEGRPVTPPPPPKLVTSKSSGTGTKSFVKPVFSKAERDKDLADAIESKAEFDKDLADAIESKAGFDKDLADAIKAGTGGLKKTGIDLATTKFANKDTNPALAALSALKAGMKTLSPEAEAARIAKFEASKAASMSKVGFSAPSKGHSVVKELLSKVEARKIAKAGEEVDTTLTLEVIKPKADIAVEATKIAELLTLVTSALDAAPVVADAPVAIVKEKISKKEMTPEQQERIAKVRAKLENQKAKAIADCKNGASLADSIKTADTSILKKAIANKIVKFLDETTTALTASEKVAGMLEHVSERSEPEYDVEIFGATNDDEWA